MTAQSGGDSASVPTSGAESGWLRDGGLVVLVRLVAMGVLHGLGFRAISDDDYSRVVIAQTFAAAPSLDPSGTSWLPLPFWLTGGVMALAGSSLAVARGLALLTSLASALLVYATARWLACDRRAALAGGVIGAALPYAARLGMATVPDGYTAALIVFAAATTANAGVRLRALGAAAATAAALCRYEAWPVAAAVAAFAILDARRRRAPHLWLVALLAAMGPLAWLLHGALHHGDALFFVTRVTAYRAALGTAPTTPLEASGELIVAWLRLEPELSALLGLGLGAAALTRAPWSRRGYLRFTGCLSGLLALVLLGEWRAAGPTHHGERALLALWLGAALIAGDTLVCAWRASTQRGRRWLLGGAGLLVALTAAGARPRWGQPAPFTERHQELAIGAAARRQVPPAATLAIDTPDYGYFAVIAAFGRPTHAFALHDHDPRRSLATAPPGGEPSWRARLRACGARWLVTTTAHVPNDLAATARARAGDLSLLELSATP